MRRIAGNVRGGVILVCESTGEGVAPLAQAAHRTTSRLERHNRELRRREQLGTVWTEHNLLALLQEQGLINQTT